jgi:hypothetical protein
VIQGPRLLSCDWAHFDRHNDFMLTDSIGKSQG